jgi:hypothetical protein
MILVTVTILILHAVGGAEISVNADKIVSMRDGEQKGEYVNSKVRCIINTNDGKFVNVIETCAEVRGRIK